MKMNAYFEAARRARIAAEVRISQAGSGTEATVRGTIEHKIIEEQIADGYGLSAITFGAINHCHTLPDMAISRAPVSMSLQESMFNARFMDLTDK